MRHQIITICHCALFALILLCFPGCSGNTTEPARELLIYCGVTMIKPMTELGNLLQQQEKCRIIITKGGSGNLLKSIKANQLGDLYLPGSETYIKQCKKEGLVTESVQVGSNKAVMMVAKGNPKNIPADLMALASPKYYVVLGNPSSGSIGRETKKILVRRGIFDEVLENVKDLTTDSKDLIRAFREKSADLVINWYATSTWPENAPYVDVLPIAPQYASEKRLVLGLLATSKYPDLAKKFMALASGKTGQAIFCDLVRPLAQVGYAGIGRDIAGQS